MKKLFLTFLIVLVSLSFFSCGKISTLKFYESCLTGDEKIVSKYLSSENFSIELSEKETSKFIETLEKFDSESLFFWEYENVFIGNPIAVSILGNNNSITKLLCEKIPIENINHDNIVYVCAKMNNIEMGKYLFEQNILPTTYLSFISMIENDNVDMFKLFSVIIDDITAEVYKTGENFLMISAQKNAVNCVKYLVDTKLFDINKYNKDYQTALGLANYYGASSEIKTYLKNAKGECLHDTVRDLVQRFDSMTTRMENLCKSKDYTYNDVLSTIQAFNSLIDSSQIKMIDLPRNMSDWQKNIFSKSFENMYYAFDKLQYL